MKFLWAIIRYGFFFCLGGAAVFAAFSWHNFHEKPANIDSGGYTLKVERGMSLAKVGAQLEKDQVIKHGAVFSLLGRITERAGKIKAGEFHLNAGMTPNQIIDVMVGGKTVSYRFTIVEGWAFKQLLNKLKLVPELKQDLKGLSRQQVMNYIGYPEKHYEGRFLPDTYQFQRGDKASSILKRAYKALNATLEKEWLARSNDLPYKSSYDALIMASIIEKETGYRGEREKVAGVFVRRLDQKWRLETDPTVIYGIGDEYDGNITRKHLRTPTPYNTYRMKGLPPTPIAMPGRKAIHAAMHPDDSDNMFFVADGSGGHKFSATYAEHKRAVACYQLKQKKSCPK